MATLLTQIKIKRDTYDNLKDKVLAAGEPAIAILSDPGNPEAFGHLQFAVGDGKQTFSNLSLKIKDGVTNLTGKGAENAIAVFTGQNNGNDIVGRNVTINDKAIMAGVKQISIENDADKAPLVIANKVLVDNLNADLLDGKQGSAYFTSDNLKFQKTTTQLPVAADGKNQLYVDIRSVVSNATITLKGTDMSITNPSFTLNQADNQEITLTVTKESSGGRKEGSIVSARGTGIIQSNEYEISYTVSGDSTIKVGATMVYDQALKAVKFVF